MADSGTIGVVTVTYNSESVLPDFFSSLFSQTYRDWILYGIDNASVDGSLSLLKQQTDIRIRLLPQSTNVGVAEGNNIGIRAALADRCKTVLLINNDVVFDEHLFETLVAGLTKYHCDMVAPKILYYEPADRIWWAGGHFQRLLGYRTVHRGENDVDRGQYGQAEQTEYASTCCVLIEASVFQQLGLMDNRYFVYYDDTDFMLRALRANKRLYYLPSVSVRHKVSSLTGGNESDFVVRYTARNRAYFWRKHLGLPIAFLFLTTYICYYFCLLVFQKIPYPLFLRKYQSLWEGFHLGAKAA